MARIDEAAPQAHAAFVRGDQASAVREKASVVRYCGASAVHDWFNAPFDRAAPLHDHDHCHG